MLNAATVKKECLTDADILSIAAQTLSVLLWPLFYKVLLQMKELF